MIEITEAYYVSILQILLWLLLTINYNSPHIKKNPTQIKFIHQHKY